MAIIRWVVLILVIAGLAGCTWGATPTPQPLPEQVVVSTETPVATIIMSTATLIPATQAPLPSPTTAATETPHAPTATSSVPPPATIDPASTLTNTPPPFTTLTAVIVDGVEILPTRTPYLGDPDGIFSLGLGLTQSQWEQLYLPSGSEGDFTIYATRDMEDGVAVLFYEEHVGYIEQYFPAPYINEAEAERAGENLMPSDAVLEEIYTPDGYVGTKVRVYYSATLAETFDAALFCESEPGYFMVHYTDYDGEIDRVTLSLGRCLE